MFAIGHDRGCENAPPTLPRPDNASQDESVENN